MIQALTVPLNDSGFLILLPSSYFCNNGKITDISISLSVFVMAVIGRCTCFIICVFIQVLGPVRKSFCRESLCFHSHDSYVEVTC